MNFGDQYTYQVVFDARGTQDVGRAAKALGTYEQAMADTASAADRYAASSRRAATATRDAAKAKQQAGNSSAQFGQGVMQLTYVMDDAAHGSRALVNNIGPLTTAMFGFGPAAAAAGFALTALGMAYRDQIDQALAYVGVLDENVVKGLERADAAADSMTSRLAEYQRRFDDFGKPVTDRASGIAEAFRDAGAEAEARVNAIVARMEEGEKEIDAAREKVEQKVDLIGKLRTPAKFALGPLFPALGDQVDAFFDKQEKKIEEFGDGVEAVGVRPIEALRDAAAKSEEDLNRLIQAAIKAGERGLAKSLWEQTEAGKAWVETQEDIEKASEDAARADQLAIEAIGGRYEKTGDLEEAIRRTEEAADAAIAAARRGDVEGARRAAAETQRHASRVHQIREEARAAEEAEAKKLEAQLRTFEEARKAADARDRDESTQRVLAALGGRFDAGISQALQNRVMAGQGLGQIGVGGATDDIAGQVVQQLVRSGVGVDAARQAARSLVEEQAAAIQAVVDTNNLNFRLNQQMLDGMSALKRMQEQYRQMIVGLMHQNARNSNRMRSNMLGTFRPF